jgi:hypothetical protein
VLTLELENIEHMMQERGVEKHKSKERAVAVTLIKGNPYTRAHLREAHLSQPRKRRKPRSFSRCARLMGTPTTLIILMSAVAMTGMGSPPDNLGVNCPRSISPSKRGAKKGWRT